MINYKTLDDLMDELLGALPASARHMQHDIETNIRSILENGLSKMHLVTREEFDVQSALVSRLQERVKQLDQRVKDLDTHKL